MPLKINFKTLLFYAAYAAAVLLLNCTLPGVPLSFGLCFAMLLSGTNIIATPALFAIASAINLDLAYSLCSLFMGAFAAAIVFLYRRTQRKLKFEAAVYFAIAMAPYVIFAEWSAFGAATNLNPYVLKLIAVLITGIFTFFCFRSVYSLLFRLARCRLREDELICISVLFEAVGAGLCSLAGEHLYVCIAAGLIIFFTRLTRSPVSVIAAIVCALPHALIKLDTRPLTAYVIISVSALLFINAGRFAPTVVTAVLSAGYMYLLGSFSTQVPYIVVHVLLLFIACILPTLPSDKNLKGLKMRLLCVNVLDGTAISRSRKRTGDKLYKISELFREIEHAFLSLDEGVDDEAMRERILIQLKDACCKTCDRAKKCEKSAVYGGFKRLIDAGCMKGKVNLIDLPSEITAACSHPAEVMSELNYILSEYRRFMTENENARSGRRLLADQAHGIAEVLKGCAVDLNRTQGDYSDGKNALKKALSIKGISCPEVHVDDMCCEISVVVCGKFNINAMSEVLQETFKRRYVLKDKSAYDDHKTCLIFAAPPKLDAVFGVAYAVKAGEKVSGDTHSVIKINEHSFLMALSDGMGSGGYARKVSEAAISLIEAFYRAEMPEETVLKTINKLLSFNRDERFTCIDIAAVNLETGRADFVKIGSPAGIIVREGEIKVLESTSLPLGIIENLKPTVCSEMLKSGDIVVFMSDGITSAFPSSTELYEFLQGLKPLNPQSLADKILAGALERAGHTASDDMTVVCTRLFDNE